MKKAITRIIAPLLIISGMLFAGLTFTAPVSALPYFGTDNVDDTLTPDPLDTDDSTDVDTDPEEDNVTDEAIDSTEDDTSAEETPEEETTPTNTCQQQAGGLAWIVCPTISFISNITDALYAAINDFLIIDPLQMDDTSPVYLVWKYMRSITNIIFIIFLAVVIYSQITGLGLNNYNIKRILPRLIITVILVNLSFLICAIAVDVSNILGANLRAFFQGIQDSITASSAITSSVEVSLSSVLLLILGGGTAASIAIGAIGGFTGSLLWPLVIILISGLIAIATGLITIAARQAVVTLLVMISPLAFIAYLLPNTERWFQQWKSMFTRMLVFYPMFSFLFGASQLAGWALIASATNAPTVLLGLAVQIFPLFFSWSLMKMSGTALGTLNATLRKMAAPAQKLATGWANEHADRARKDYWANSYTSGSRLRGYLDYRQKLRQLDAKNAGDIRENRALERAYLKASSITGRDAQGNTTWEKTPNKYARNAKTASYYATKSGTAQLAYKNTTTAYGRHFGNNDDAAQRLNTASGEAYLDAMAQQYLAINEAQADQDFLLQRYLGAINTQFRNRREFNRLVRDAAGGLGYNGEASIMGQVIVNNSAIENRRRSEATIVKNKFGYSKTAFRAMIHDVASMNDDGYETDEHGVEIEDSEYHLKIDPKTGQYYKRRKWDQYIWVDKATNASISREDYDALPDKTKGKVKGKDAYRKVNYMYIYNDQGDPVQCIYDDDAGYMKELLTDDVNIGDPINKRYMSEIGVDPDGSNPGILRRYHSTIYAALLNSNYKQHFAPATPMLASQTDHGFVNGKSQFNIASLQSFVASSKPGAFLRNDGVNIREMTNWILSATDDEMFDKFFTAEAIMKYRNVNGAGLKGLRLGQDKDGNDAWVPVPAHEASLEEKRNMLKHKVIPEAARKMVDAISRVFTPGVTEDMKIDGLESLDAMQDIFKKIALGDLDPSLDFSEQLQGGKSIYDIPNVSGLNTKVQQTRAEISQRRGGTGRYDQFEDGLGRAKEEARRRRERNNTQTIIGNIEAIAYAHTGNIEGFIEAILNYFGELEVFKDLQDQYKQIIEQYRYDTKATSTDEVIRNDAEYQQRAQQRLDAMKQALVDFTIQHPYRGN